MHSQTTTTTIKITDYTFEGPTSSTGNLRHATGVYVILDKRAGERWHIIDVGESSDVRMRVENHDRQACWERNRRGTLGVAVLYTPRWTGTQRRQLESAIRRTFHPPCGDR